MTQIDFSEVLSTDKKVQKDVNKDKTLLQPIEKPSELEEYYYVYKVLANGAVIEFIDRFTPNDWLNVQDRYNEHYNVLEINLSRAREALMKILEKEREDNLKAESEEPKEPEPDKRYFIFQFIDNNERIMLGTDLVTDKYDFIGEYPVIDHNLDALSKMYLEDDRYIILPAINIHEAEKELKGIISMYQEFTEGLWNTDTSDHIKNSPIGQHALSMKVKEMFPSLYPVLQAAIKIDVNDSSNEEAAETSEPEPEPEPVDTREAKFSIENEKFQDIINIVKTLNNFFDGTITFQWLEEEIVITEMESSGAVFIKTYIPKYLMDSYDLDEDLQIAVNISDLVQRIKLVKKEYNTSVKFEYLGVEKKLQLKYAAMSSEIKRKFILHTPDEPNNALMERAESIPLNTEIIFRGSEQILELRELLKQSKPFEKGTAHLTFEITNEVFKLSSLTDGGIELTELNLSTYRDSNLDRIELNQDVSDYDRIESSVYDYDYIGKYLVEQNALLSSKDKIKQIEFISIEFANNNPIRLRIEYLSGIYTMLLMAPLDSDEDDYDEDEDEDD